MIRWLMQGRALGLITLPNWGWAVIVAVLTAAATLAAWAIATARARREAADHEITQAFITEMRLHGGEPETPQDDGPAGPDDIYPAAPATAGASRAQDAGGLAVVDEFAETLAAATWETALERITRAEDALIEASDPAAFDDWLAADWAAYLEDVKGVDAILASGAWAAPTWRPARVLAGAQ